MPRLRNPFATSIGSKTVMAITGLLLFGFVLAHMVGNLQIFAGPAKLNGYAKTLQDLGPLLWVMRGGLLVIFLTHLFAAFSIWRANQAARPVAYVSAKPQVTTYAARTMVYGGLIVLAFVVYHLAHFTFGWVAPGYAHLEDPLGRHDVYAMVVLGFRVPAIAISYVVAQAVLALHLSHGLSSAFQTLGVTHPRLAFLKAGFGKAVAAVIFVGNVSMPLTALLGGFHLPAECVSCGGR
jgi:succinate dehydrogenase / fumarate reductase, cytochrome b subunit